MRKRVWRKRFLRVALIVAIGAFAFSLTNYRNIQKVYTEADKAYEELRESVRSDSPESLARKERAPQVEIPERAIDFQALRLINDDSIGWLYSPETPIDYPVMGASDYSWYLSYLPDGTPNANGSLFLDYNSKRDFSSKLSIIYGHHMQSGQMFGSLVEYKKQDYFDRHPYLYLYTEQGNYRIDLVYGCVIDAGMWRERAFMYEANLRGLLNYASEMTTFSSEVQYIEGDRFVTLSTCSFEFDDARYVVIGVLVPEFTE